jgi:hypothetical protein
MSKSRLFAADGSVIPNIPLGQYKLVLIRKKRHQVIQGAEIEFLAPPDEARNAADEICEYLPLMGFGRLDVLREP